jgi:hypothetical protein
MKKLHWVAVAMTLVLTAQPLGAQAFPSSGVIAYRVLLRAAYGDLQRFLTYLAPSKPGFRADGGSSDGGGSDGSGSSGDGSGSGAAGAAGSGAAGAGGASSDGTGGSGDGTGTGDGGGSSTGDGDSSSDSSSDSASASDAASAAAATASAAAATSTATDAATDAVAATTTTTTTTTTTAAPGNTNDDAPDNNAPPTDPTNNAIAVAPPTDPNNAINAVSPIDAIQSLATTDPRGGSAPDDFPDTGSVPESVTTIPPGGPAPAEPVDVEIHAVIISAAQSPWDAVKRGPGVRNVIVVGGIVALGQTPIPGEFPGGGPEPDWLRVIPDLSLLNGSKIPPVVPNIIDIRIMNCPITIGPPPNQVEDANP